MHRESETNSGYAEGIPVEQYPSRRKEKQPRSIAAAASHNFSIRNFNCGEAEKLAISSVSSSSVI
jgi:hypothetical protein